MADKKISQLTNITGANLADTDEFVVVDSSADETKAITWSELKEGLDTGTGFVRITGDTMTGALDVQSTITADGLTVDGDISATGGDVDLDTLDLNAIAESKAVTAVDVFVYDTSKDSDGGAWRKRTQGTSWYNETLNTATRGSRREFPAVAVIVAEAAKVTIYDGDDPSLPMWMVFTRNTAVTAFIREDTITCVSALNGIISFGGNSGTAGIASAHFIPDFARKVRNTAQSGSSTTSIYGPLADRNISTYLVGGNASLGLVNTNVNDVAMTILADSPIDPATGLPVPTIAVATDGGVSVIKDDGTVVDSASTVAMRVVFFDTAFGVWAGRNASTHTLMYSTVEDYQAGDGFGDIVAETTTATAWEFPLLVRPMHATPLVNHWALGNNFGPVSHAKDGLMLHQPNYTDQSKGMSALLTSDYNTGWMNGDIKGAFLSDTDDTDLVGSGELVTNGTFDADIAGWTEANATATVSAGVVTVENTGNYGYIYQDFALEVGRTYTFQYEKVSGSPIVGLLVPAGTPVYANNSGLSQITFTATINTLRVRIGNTVSGVGAVSSFDNVSVKLADAAGVSGAISESKTDALCYEAADMIEELEAIVASMESDIHEMEKRNEN